MTDGRRTQKRIFPGRPARPRGSRQEQDKKKWGFPERRLHGKPRQECLRRRVTLPHPAGCSTITVPGLSFRVRKGTGRHTWAMATAKTTINGPDPQKNRGPRPAKRKTTHAPPPARAVTVREPDSGREHRFVTTGTTLLVANNPAAAKTRTHPHTRGNGMLCRRRPLVPVGSTPRGASTSGLSNTCSTCGLQDPEGPKES